MNSIGPDISFSTAATIWDNASILMQSVDESLEEFDAERILNIVEGKYLSADQYKNVSDYNLLNTNKRKKEFINC
jgi:hypothetical protein